jgi:hypothetical protein
MSGPIVFQKGEIVPDGVYVYIRLGIPTLFIVNKGVKTIINKAFQATEKPAVIAADYLELIELGVGLDVLVNTLYNIGIEQEETV